MKAFALIRYAALILVLLCALIAAPPVSAKDISGAKDHPLIKRFEGSEIVWYAQKSYDALRLALDPVVFNYNDQKFDPYKKLDLEGRKTTIFYTMPAGIGTLEAVRNYENELKEKGFEILFSASGENLERNKGDNIASEIYGVTPANSNREHPTKSRSPAPIARNPSTSPPGSPALRKATSTLPSTRSKPPGRPPR